jgi:PIN domain
MHAPSDLPPPMNYVFVDLENVHEVDPALIGTKAVSFTLLMGAKQTKLDAALVEKMLVHAAAVELIRLTSSGKNALDFALAYYLGRKALADPTAYFHVITKDKGYDPLIEHLRSRHLNVRRHDDFSTLTFSHKVREILAVTKVAPEVTKVEPSMRDNALSRVLEHLRKNVNNRPKKKATLLSHLKSNLGKGATDADVAKVFEKLRKAGHLVLDNKDAITYQL